MATHTVSKEFFEQKYRADQDPWSFASSSYELNRYDEIVRALGVRTFASGFEPGCSVGVLTELLADRCQRLFAIDISPTAVAVAQHRCAHFPNVTIREGALPDDIPDDTFDLIVFSEIGYYFDRPGLARVRDLVVDRLAHRGVLIGAHWLGVSADHVLSGDAVHDVLRASSALKMTASKRYAGFLLESWERT